VAEDLHLTTHAATGMGIRIISLSKLLHYYMIQSNIHPLVNKQLI